MRLFVPLFFTLFTLLHYYLYRKISGAFPLKGQHKVFLLVLFAFTITSPVLWKFLDRNGHPELVGPVAFLSLFWLGFLVYFIISGLLVDIYGRFRSISSKRTFAIALITALSLSLYSHIETYMLEVNRYTIKSDKIPVGVSVKILHISDLHLGPVMRDDRISMVLEVYRKERPDMVVATGDIVDGNMRNFNHLAQMFAQMNPPLGKFAVVGNHEYYAGLGQSIEFLQRAGFRVLRGEIVRVREFLRVGGVDDPAGERIGYKVFTDEGRLFRDDYSSAYTILLKHRPQISSEALPHVDLLLAGHTHGGVIFLVGYTVLRLLFETDRGMKKLTEGKYVVVSKGVGTGGPPMRLLSPPDVVVITLSR